MIKDFNPLVSIKKSLAIPQLKALFVVGFLINLSVPIRHLIFPLLVIDKFGMTNTNLSLIIFIFGFMHLFQFYFGSLADKYSSERFIFWGNVVVALCIAALIFIESYVWLIPLTIVYSIAGSFWNVSCWSYLSKFGEKHKIEGHVVGGYIALAHKSHAISFIITGFLLSLSFTYVYLFYILAIVVGLVLTKKYFMNIALQKS